MSYTDKYSITAWWIIAFMSLILWYRNLKYDRIISVYIFTLALIQLIEYGIYSGTNKQQSARAVYITMWLQCLIFAIGVYIFINKSNHVKPGPATQLQKTINLLAGWNLFLFAAAFVVALTLSFTNDFNFSLDSDSDFVQYYVNDQPMLNNWGWLYILGSFSPLVLLILYFDYNDIASIILFLIGLFYMIYILNKYPHSCLASSWSYFGIIIAFVVWVLGMYS